MYRDILVSVDLDAAEVERRAIETAVDYARVFGATLHVMTVVPEYGLSMVGSYFPEGHERESLARADAALHDFARRFVPEAIRHRHIVAHGSIYREILRMAETVGADLIVLSAARPGPEDYFIGPNAARVVRHAKVSVLVVR